MISVAGFQDSSFEAFGAENDPSKHSATDYRKISDAQLKMHDILQIDTFLTEDEKERQIDWDREDRWGFSAVAAGCFQHSQGGQRGSWSQR